MIKTHKYRDLKPDQQEELFSNFLMDSWSYSKTETFARNEKAFEMVYVYNMPYKSSASTVAGKAYHEALEYFFLELQKGITHDIADLEIMAYNYIDEVEADKWKVQKTTPSIEECKIKATADVTNLLQNFYNDISVYLDELQSVLYVELYTDEFLVINGVEIPLPCHAMIDLVIKTKDNKVVIIDHKSKSVYTDEKDIKFSVGKQAITYVNSLEAHENITVHEVWFIENKITKNKDKSPQLVCNKIVIDDDTRKLYEAMLYEPLKRMLEAISNPDYVYLINENDNFVDKAEIYDFWARSMMAEIGDYNVPENKRDMIERRLKKIRDVSIATISPSAIKKFRENAASFIQYDLSNKNMTREQKIEHVLRTLSVIVEIKHTFSGYSSDTFLLEMSAGTKIDSIFKYKLDIANALSVPNVRIMKDLYIHEGKSYVAVEASKQREKNLIFDAGQLNGTKIPLGFDNFSNLVYWDTANPSTPHMLVGGSTGSGKSVFLISIIEYAKLAGFDSIEIFDPKFEFTKFNSGRVSVYSDISDIEAVMETLVEEMNGLVKSGRTKKTLIVFDEFADAVANSRKGIDLNVYGTEVTGHYANGNAKTKNVIVETKKTLEENLRILLQKGRSSGYRIVAATQRASVKVITGDAKANFGVLVSFKLPKEIDSKVMLDEPGAEALSGKGDGLIKSPQFGGIVRFQAFYKEQ
jgi:DNA segregation ATPase FtsK/SpoIIIE, S-DNA-T family